MASVGTVISYPIPLYANVAIEPQNYQPNYFLISSISYGQITTVTTSANHNYVVGQNVRLLIPETNGAFQLSGKSGIVIAIPAANQVVLNLNSTNAEPFVSSSQPNQPQIVAIGDINSGNVSANGSLNVPTNVLGAFINVGSGL